MNRLFRVFVFLAATAALFVVLPGFNPSTLNEITTSGLGTVAKGFPRAGGLQAPRCMYLRTGIHGFDDVQGQLHRGRTRLRLRLGEADPEEEEEEEEVGSQGFGPPSGEKKIALSIRGENLNTQETHKTL